MNAYLNLRYLDDSRARLFRAGLSALGYHIIPGLCTKPEPHDILVSWNRIGAADYAASCFKQHGCPVIIAENASFGNEFAGDRWYHITRDYHNEAGRYPIGGPERWDALGVELTPFRERGETVILPQRGIGPDGSAMPRGWLHGKNGRVRMHPGKRTDVIPLDKDLANAGRVITWGSGAAIKALMWGIPVQSDFPRWIGQQDNTVEGRLAMFRRLIWAQWRLSEIESGAAFAWLLGRQQP